MANYVIMYSGTSSDVWAGALSWLQNSLLVFPQFCAFLTLFLTIGVYFKVVFLIDCMTLWQEFMIHHAIAIEENCEQNPYIWPNLTCFFQPWLFWTLALGWLGFIFNVTAEREYDINVSVLVRGMCPTQRKIVSNIFKCNQIICICSGKYKKNTAPNRI